MNEVCIDCEKKPAVTNDGKLCKACLKARIRELTPIPKTPGKMRGRKSISLEVIAGCCEMRANDSE